MKHHAFCYIGIESAHQELAELFAANDPDVHVEEYSDFGIQEARSLALRASSMPIQAAEQVFAIVANNVTHEAQNALLKLFEEPPSRVVFHLVVPKRGLLLPTLQSRLHFGEASPTEATHGYSEYFDNFTKMTYAERLAEVATISKAKDTGAIDELVSGAEVRAAELKEVPLLKTVLMVRNELGKRGASAKMLLEALSLALPEK